MGRSKIASAMLEPTINLIRPIPVTAWVPLTLIMIGIEIVPQFSSFSLLLCSHHPEYRHRCGTGSGTSSEAAAMLGTSKGKALWKVVFPAALPSIIGGLRVAVGLAWALLVVGEMTGITVGLGAMITEAKNVSKTDLIVAGMFIIGILGFSQRSTHRLDRQTCGARSPILPTAK